MALARRVPRARTVKRGRSMAGEIIRRIDSSPELSRVQKQTMSFQFVRALMDYEQEMGESLKLFEPTPGQTAFLDCTSKERVCIGGNRSGKTLSAAVAVARAVTGQEANGMSPKRGGIIYCVAKEWKEVGEVLYPMLFEPGAFRVIRDLTTGMMRAFRPWTDEDRKRESEAVDADPLIPQRFYDKKDISWYTKRLNQPSMIYLKKSDWTIYFYSSAPGSSPPQGSAINAAWFDEEILDDVWYDEVSARLLSKNGWFLWSASPELSTPKYKDMYDRAVKEARVQADPGKRRISAFQLSLMNNPHLNQEARAGFIEKLQDSQRFASKVHGMFAFDESLVHPEFNEQLFTINAFPIPFNWTLRMAVDPGHAVCCVLFIATPPDNDPQWGGHRILYDELYIRKCDAEQFGLCVKEKTVDLVFHEFIIDQQGFRLTDIGGGRSVGDQYMEQMDKLGIESDINGSGFSFSIKDELAGRMHVKSWLRLMPDGKPKLLIMDGRCPNTVREFTRYQKQRQGGRIIDKPVTTKYHAMDVMRYLAANGCEYVQQAIRETPTKMSHYEWLMSPDSPRKRANQAVIAFGASA
jgi:hypothetical protein